MLSLIETSFPLLYARELSSLSSFCMENVVFELTFEPSTSIPFQLFPTSFGRTPL